MDSHSERLFGVLGHPLGHSLSPAMHTAVFEHLRLPYKYGLFDIAGEFLPSFIASLRRGGIAGVNITIPYKELVIPLLDSVHEDASALGAVNTIAIREGRLEGFNTDVEGIRAMLSPAAEKIAGASALVLGAGGAARALVYTLARNFAAKSIRVFNRSSEKGNRLVADFQKKFPKGDFQALGERSDLAKVVAQSSLIVNATSVGMSPKDDASPLPDEIRFSNHQIIVDIVYNPVETVLLGRAKRDGAQTIGGVEMFVHQGAGAFALWTGREFPLDVARKAVLNGLKQ
ncbi:MAG TPA: shikimate dehydrogenase [Bacteroidota bacterium]|nr:shikimate dehydrogenase [Bacteroidota bacterium]